MRVHRDGLISGGGAAAVRQGGELIGAMRVHSEGLISGDGAVAAQSYGGELKNKNEDR